MLNDRKIGNSRCGDVAFLGGNTRTWLSDLHNLNSNYGSNGCYSDEWNTEKKNKINRKKKKNDRCQPIQYSPNICSKYTQRKSNGLTIWSFLASSSITRPFSSFRISMMVCIRREDNSSASANEPKTIITWKLRENLLFMDASMYCTSIFSWYLCIIICSFFSLHFILFLLLLFDSVQRWKTHAFQMCVRTCCFWAEWPKDCTRALILYNCTYAGVAEGILKLTRNQTSDLPSSVYVRIW